MHDYLNKWELQQATKQQQFISMIVIIITCANAITLSKCFYLCSPAIKTFLSAIKHFNQDPILGAGL